MSRYGKAMGIWSLKVGAANLDLHPTVDDNRKFRQIMLGKHYEKDHSGKMDAFENWLFRLITKEYVPVDEEESEDLKGQISFNSIPLFEKTMVDFGYSSEEELAKAKDKTETELKK